MNGASVVVNPAIAAAEVVGSAIAAMVAQASNSLLRPFRPAFGNAGIVARFVGGLDRHAIDALGPVGQIRHPAALAAKRILWFTFGHRLPADRTLHALILMERPRSRHALGESGEFLAYYIPNGISHDHASRSPSPASRGLLPDRAADRGHHHHDHHGDRDPQAAKAQAEHQRHRG